MICNGVPLRGKSDSHPETEDCLYCVAQCVCVRLDLNVDSFRLNCICDCARKKERNRKDGASVQNRDGEGSGS